MNVKEAFLTINKVVQEIYGQVSLVLSQDGFVIKGKYKTIYFDYNPWNHIVKNGLTTDIFKPIAREVFKNFCENARNIHADICADIDDENLGIAQNTKDILNNDIEWARTTLGELLQ